MVKKELTITEFRAIIKEEALKLKKRIVLENEKRNLQKELNSLLKESCCEEEIEVDEIFDKTNLGPFGRLAGHEGSYRADIINTVKKEGDTLTEPEVDKLLAQMVADKGQGMVMKSRGGKWFYKPSVRVAPHGAGAPGGGFSSNI